MMARNLPPAAKGAILLLFLALLFAGSLIGGDGPDPTAIASPNQLKLLQTLSVIVLFILPTLAFVLATSEKKLGYLQLGPFNISQGMGAVLLVFTSMPVINWLGEMNNNMKLPEFLSGVEHWMRAKEDMLKGVTDTLLQMNSVGDLVSNLLVIALLAAVSEELLFRGALQNVLVEWTKNKHVSVWVTAILFSALHAQFYGFLPRMLLGVVLGYLYIWSRSLWLPMLFHFLNNGLAVLASYLIQRGTIPESAETVGANDALPFVALGLVLSLALLYYIHKNRTEEVLPIENDPSGGIGQ